MGKIVEKLRVSIDGIDESAPCRFEVCDPRQIILGLANGCLGLITYTEQGEHLLPEKRLVDIDRIPENNIRILIPEEAELLSHINAACWSIIISSLENKIHLRERDFHGLFENRKKLLIKRRDWKEGLMISNRDFSKDWTVTASEK
jgi:hypothetical protein